MRGWSRHLLQTGNHRGNPGRKKKWDYWSIHAGDLIITGVVANLDFFGADANAWGVIDIGRGRWAYRTVWNWGGGAGRSNDGSVIGLQVGGKWTEGTGYTENGIFVDGRLSKIGRELEWSHDWDYPMKPWRVRDAGGHINVVLTPRREKHSVIDTKVMRGETHQVFGT